MLHLAALVCWSVYLADIGPNETQVALALIGAIASLVNTLYLGRARHDRKKHEEDVRQAIAGRGLVAMVPEKVVRDVAQAPAPAPAKGDEAP